MKRLIASLIEDIYNTLNKKGLDTSVVDTLQKYMFNDKQISLLVSLKYGFNGKYAMNSSDWDRLVHIVTPNMSIEQIEMIAKLILRGRSDEQIALLEKHNLDSEEMAIVDQNFFDTNEPIEQAKAWIKKYFYK